MSDVWPTVHAERLALADDLEGRPAADFRRPSLLPGWTVHDVVAHLVDDAKTTPVRFVAQLAAAFGSFDRLNARGLSRERFEDPAETVAALRLVADRSTGAPGAPETRLVEQVVHGEDIRRPLGIEHAYPLDAVRQALRYQLRTSVGMGGGRERAADLRLVATDIDEAYGSGPDVCGTALALLLAVSGRPVGEEELTGAGAGALHGATGAGGG